MIVSIGTSSLIIIIVGIEAQGSGFLRSACVAGCILDFGRYRGEAMPTFFKWYIQGGNGCLQRALTKLETLAGVWTPTTLYLVVLLSVTIHISTSSIVVLI